MRSIHIRVHAASPNPSYLHTHGSLGDRRLPRWTQRPCDSWQPSDRTRAVWIEDPRLRLGRTSARTNLSSSIPVTKVSLHAHAPRLASNSLLMLISRQHKVDLRVGINNRLRFSPSHFFFFYLLRRLPEVTTYGVVRHQIDLLDRENTIYSLLFLLGLRK